MNQWRAYKNVKQVKEVVLSQIESTTFAPYTVDEQLEQKYILRRIYYH